MSKVSGSISDEEAEEYHSSGDNWTAKSTKKKLTTRRTSQRLRKKPRISIDMEDSSDSEGDAGITKRKKSKTPAKLRRNSLPAGKNIINKEFLPGGFLVQKKDVQTGDTSKPPCLWRIDGKALLQKYEAFDDEGKVLHRSTSVYTGWSALDKDLYAPVTVRVQWHASQQMTVESNWDTLKNATMDSD